MLSISKLRTICCELYTKIQKMKAIHNMAKSLSHIFKAVNYTQRYKKWKQFTTVSVTKAYIEKLWTIHKDTKNESNSQLIADYCQKLYCCELYTKIQKMKAIHNSGRLRMGMWFAVNYTQRYKKWKQFTTQTPKTAKPWVLWTIHKDTKNESNSQPSCDASFSKVCCELYTKIQKMKAIHNWCRAWVQSPAAVNYTQRYKKWKQFTTRKGVVYIVLQLWTIHKDTKNESNSQRA